MESAQHIHGFRVLAHGSITPGFRRALLEIQSKGFADESCVIVKTTLWKRSAITHEGGRYLHPMNPRVPEVTRAMRELGIEPPPLPFILAPGAMTVFHEWGHHVDHCWSRLDYDVPFSFRWFSHFYQVSHPPSPFFATEPSDEGSATPAMTSLRVATVAPQWRGVASELFADLFEYWMRGGRGITPDLCAPANLDHRACFEPPFIRLDLRPGVSIGEVRTRTLDIFEGGLRLGRNPPEVREDLFGVQTAGLLNRIRAVMNEVRND